MSEMSEMSEIPAGAEYPARPPRVQNQEDEHRKTKKVTRSRNSAPQTININLPESGVPTPDTHGHDPAQQHLTSNLPKGNETLARDIITCDRRAARHTALHQGGERRGPTRPSD